MNVSSHPIAGMLDTGTRRNGGCCARNRRGAVSRKAVLERRQKQFGRTALAERQNVVRSTHRWLLLQSKGNGYDT